MAVKFRHKETGLFWCRAKGLCPWQERNKDFWDLKVNYQVFMSDSIDMIQNAVKGRIKGTFTWVKEGSNYGIKLVVAKE